MGFRKSICDLTIDDIRRFPLWEYAPDEEGVEGQDETSVRPVDLSSPLDFSRTDLWIRAIFRLASGTVCSGLVTLGGERDDSIVKIIGDVDHIAQRQPLIITSKGQIGIYYGWQRPSRSEINASYGKLGGTDAKEVFPIEFSSDVPLSIQPIVGRIAGFVYLEEQERPMEFRIAVVM